MKERLKIFVKNSYKITILSLSFGNRKQMVSVCSERPYSLILSHILVDKNLFYHI